MPDNDDVRIHISGSKFRGPPKNDCPHKNTEDGFGLAGGGFGPYTYCTDCNYVISKFCLPDDEV
jgi:hypothetical protein